MTVTFYSESDGRLCLRYDFKNAPRSSSPARIAASCAASPRASLVALQGLETDAAGATYSITVGRTLSDKVTVVTVEFSNGESLPVQVDEGGFIVVLPGRRGALRAIPIDQYGNLVGERFTFNK